jgi:uncharacterized Ntn-hydrolase superfamily protein
MTFSIVARCAETGGFGMAISSSSPAVAARCAFARAGVGAVASQNVTDPRLGNSVITALADGYGAKKAVTSVVGAASHTAYRQVMAVDAAGDTAIFTGAQALGINAEFESMNAAAAGNLLGCKTVPQTMVTAFHAAAGHLGDRLIAALCAGLEAGGEAGTVHSAGLLLVDQHEWPLADLRCDWTMDCPVAAVTEAWRIYKPQMDDYVIRAISPDLAPNYGVPGDE